MSDPTTYNGIQLQGLTLEKLARLAVTVRNIKAYGAVGDGSTDDTDTIQAAANEGGNIYFPSGTYMIRGKPVGVGRLGVKPVSNSVWIFEPGAILKVIGQADPTYAAINIESTVDSVILYSPTIDGNKANVSGSGGQGHGIYINGASNLRIYDPYSHDCYGDGIHLTGSADGIYTTGGIFDNNRRIGCAITDALNITFQHCVFSGSAGTSPEKGVDIEPNNANALFTNISFIDCLSKNNAGRGFSPAIAYALTNGVSVAFIGCRSEDDSQEGFLVEETRGVDGTISLYRCEAIRSGLAGFRIKDSDVRVVVDGLYIEDANESVTGNEHLGSAFVVSNSQDNSSSGNVSARNVHVNNDSGNTLYAIDTVRFGGLSSAYVTNVSAEITTVGLTEAKLVSRRGNAAEYTGVYDVRFPENRIQTITAGDATPSVAGKTILKTANTGATTITALDDGYEGQEVLIIIDDNYTTIDFTSTTLKGNAGVDWSPASGDHMRSVFDGTNWHCEVSDNTA